MTIQYVCIQLYKDTYYIYIVIYIVYIYYICIFCMWGGVEITNQQSYWGYSHDLLWVNAEHVETINRNQCLMWYTYIPGQHIISSFEEG
jgi:hypothetical protein